MHLAQTAMAVYQRSQLHDWKPDLVLGDPLQSRSIKELPHSITELMDCPKPASRPQSTVYPSFTLLDEAKIPSRGKLPDTVWLLGRVLVRPQSPLISTQAAQGEHVLSIPTWSGFHSLISHTMSVTRVGTPHLIVAPAHECQTLLVVLMQAQKINTKVVGPARKTVVSLDMGLYKPAKQLQMACDNLHHLVFQPGELQIVMAQLRAMGSWH